MNMNDFYKQGQDVGNYYLKRRTSEQIEKQIRNTKIELKELEYDHEYEDAAILRGELSAYYNNGFESAKPEKAKF
jgi:protein-arginine kinase activator protein McsA